MKFIFTALIAFLASSITSLAAPAPQGFIIFTDPPSDYAQGAEFTSYVQSNWRYSTIITANGSQEQVQNSGIIGIVNYPTGQETETDALRESEIIQALQRKCPQEEFRQRLQNAQSKWQNALSLAKQFAQVHPAAATASNSSAQTTTFITTDGTKYAGVKITGHDDGGITVESDSGIEHIAFERLPKEMQQRFQYDPSKSAALRAKTTTEQNNASSSEPINSTTVEATAITNVEQQLKAVTDDLAATQTRYNNLGLEQKQLTDSMDSSPDRRLLDEKWRENDRTKAALDVQIRKLENAHAELMNELNAQKDEQGRVQARALQAKEQQDNANQSAKLREYLSQWTADTAIVPNELIDTSADPSYDTTVEFINGIIGNDQSYGGAPTKMWFGKKTGKMIMETESEIIIFDPSGLSPNVKYTASDEGRQSVTISCTNEKREIQSISKYNGQSEQFSSFRLPAGDNIDRDKLVKACGHLIEMFGGKPDAF